MAVSSRMLEGFLGAVLFLSGARAQDAPPLPSPGASAAPPSPPPVKSGAELVPDCQLIYERVGVRGAGRIRIEVDASGGKAEFVERGRERAYRWKAQSTRECHRFLKWAEAQGLERPGEPEPEPSPAPQASESPAPALGRETLSLQWTLKEKRTWKLEPSASRDAQKFAEFLIRFARRRAPKRAL